MPAGEVPRGPDRRRVLLVPLLDRQGHAEPAAAPVGSPIADRGLGARVRMMEQALVSQTPAQIAQALLDAIADGYGLDRGVLLSGTPRLRVLARRPGDGSDGGAGTSAAVDRAQELRSAQLVLGLAADEPYLAALLGIGVDALILPLVVDARSLGVAVVQVPAELRTSPSFPDLTAELERTVRNAALILHGLNQRSQLQRLAATDGLTKIPNRRSFDASLERELARSGRSGEPVSLVILDIDHFKQINDLHGHQAGDEALRNVAAALTFACREFDTAARYGGEEFAVILPDCSKELSVTVAERFRQAVAAAPAVRALTASAGVATFPDHGSSLEQLVRAADEALLLAKKGGRNRTVTARDRATADEVWPLRRPPSA